MDSTETLLVRGRVQHRAEWETGTLGTVRDAYPTVGLIRFARMNGGVMFTGQPGRVRTAYLLRRERMIGWRGG
ncbi:MAG: hypothetical protein ACREX4_19100 [Gammaproteobacteria bacterium]